MKEFKLDSAKEHVFVLVDLQKEKYIQLLVIDKENNNKLGFILHNQPSEEQLSARLKLFSPTHEKILSALEYAQGSSIGEIKRLKNKIPALDNDMFIVCAIKEFLEWAISPNPCPSRRLFVELDDLRNIKDMQQICQEMVFNCLKKQLQK
jgi:hypothetical protein